MSSRTGHRHESFAQIPADDVGDVLSVIVWFRLDLRLEDNPALAAAVEAGAPVIPVFIWAPEEEEPWPPGAASRWWLHQSLKALSERLESVGSRLILRTGPTIEALRNLISETGARAVFWNRRYEPAVRARDGRVETALRDEGIEVRTFNTALLFEPREGERVFQVFTSFWKRCLDQPQPPKPVLAPKQVTAPHRWPRSVDIAEFSLEPRIDWAGGIRATWTPGEAAANAVLKQFGGARSREYTTQRDFPDERGTSRLSPHLHFGEISVRKVWHAVDGNAYRREIGWREFAYHLLFHFPRTTNEPLRPEFSEFPWQKDAVALKRWQKGRTGYPLVDAGMRELWATGWMHNRVRLVVASFLTKHLRISWEEGAYWFWDTLVDADLANNTLGWQWSAGSGADAAPYFRIFNPVLQSEKFDPDGKYIQRWVPELKGLAPPYIHKPWLAPTRPLDYPEPIVDHPTARREALAAFEQMQKGRAVTGRA